jgi:hypothetical protein
MAPPAAAAPAVITVNSTGDQPDALVNGICATSLGTCTLRAALREAQGDATANTINFAIPGAGRHTIQLGSSLPEVSDTAPTTINGYSESGSAVNTHASVSNAVLQIQIRGLGPAAAPEGLVLRSAGNVVRGLAFFNLRIGVRITGAGATRNLVVGNFIGTDAAGTFGLTGSNSGAPGLFLSGGATANQIGRPGAADRNVISGNAGNGVGIGSPPTVEENDANKVQNNIIGLSPDGSRKLANLNHGVDVNAGASSNLIGGPGAGEGNVASGNAGSGVEVSHGRGGNITDQNQIIGNKIGINATGTAGPAYARNGVGNVQSGQNVRVEDGVTNTLVAGNVIGNSENGGIRVDADVTGTRIQNNRIGRTITGVAVSNGNYGVELDLGTNNTVVGPGNVIAHNESGVRIRGASTITNTVTAENTVTANSIFSNDGLGIDLEPIGAVNQNDSGDGDTGANTRLNFPVLTAATPESVTGTACASCRVEVFVADTTNTDGTQAGAYGEGRTLVGAGDTDGSGNFTIRLAGAAGRTITATATDDAGNTSEFARNRVVPTSYASDNFNRSVVGGWGNASAGGPWTPVSNPESFAVNGQKGTISVPAGQARQIELRSINASRLSVVVTVDTNRLPTGGSHLIFVVARRRDAATMYRARLRLAPNGSVHAGVEVNGTLLDEEPVGGLSHTPGTPLRLRAQVTGTNPTTIRVKAWKANSSEPSAFALTVTDNTSGLQQGGAVGLGARSTETVGGPVAVTFDDLSAVSPK